MILPYPRRFRLALLGATLAKPLRSLIRRFGFKEVTAMLDMAARTPAKRAVYSSPQTVKTTTARRGRVAMLAGCAQRVLRPGINDATVRFLNHIGYDVVLPQDGCCGALVLHMGKEGEAKAFAKRNIDTWWALREHGPLDAIIINASGCGTTVKDYGHLFAQDPAYADKARFISSIAKDITEFAAGLQLDAPKGWSDIRVAYHSACSMQHGQRINEPPRKLLRNAGFTVVEIPEGHICCGSAGTYNILQPEIANELRSRKLSAISRVEPDCVATGNIGCISQLTGGSAPIVHTVELLDWAYGGPCPEELTHLRGRVHDMHKEFGEEKSPALLPG
jgi:glycolate oxidase iron-sulfur subunit